MPTTDGPDPIDLDRRQAPPIEPIPSRTKALVGCGCLGISTLVLLLGTLVLAILVVSMVIPDWRINNRYREGTCVVLDRRIHSSALEAPPGRNPPVQKHILYRPEIKIQYEVNGRTLETWCYDGIGTASDNRGSQQVIADSFKVGATYPFWYDPDRPEQAVLRRAHNWLAYAFLILPFGMLILGGSGIGIALYLTASRRRSIVVAGDRPTPLVPLAPPSTPWIQIVRTPPPTLDLSRFADPVAGQTEWSCMQGRKRGLRTHGMVEVDADRIAFRATWKSFLVALAFVFMGTLVTYLIITQVIAGFRTGILHANLWGPLLIALSFVGAGGFMLYDYLKPIVFDKRMGSYWKSWKRPDEWSNEIPRKDSVSLKDIHALQIVTTGSDRFGTIELNLILHDGSRRPVVYYPRIAQNQFRGDVSILARFLDRPIWEL